MIELTRRDFMKGLAATVAAIAVPLPVIPSWFSKEEVEKQVFAMEFNTVPGQTYRVTFNMKLTGGEWTRHDHTFVAVDARTKIIPIQKGRETYLQDIVASEVHPEVDINMFANGFKGDSDWAAWNTPSDWIQSDLIAKHQSQKLYLNPKAKHVNPTPARLKRAKQYMRT